MQLEDYFDFLGPNDIRLKGHRIGIESILYEYIHRSQTPEEIAIRFPTLNLEQIYATILYYLHHKEQVHAYLTAWLEHEDFCATFKRYPRFLISHLVWLGTQFCGGVA
jgi:uncharacterized protein (DUF433 family)